MHEQTLATSRATLTQKDFEQSKTDFGAGKSGFGAAIKFIL